METNAPSFSIFLKEELLKRQSKNTSYSLRAFSKSLGLSSSFVSKVLNGKKNISPKTMMTIASRIEVDEEVIETLLSHHPKYKAEASVFESVAIDQFQYISDWHHFAILEAVTLYDFESNPKWFANRLGITEDRAALALQRLIRLGMLKTNSEGEITGLVKNHTTIGVTAPSSANTEHERQLLHKAIEALDEFSTTERSQSSMTMAIPASRFLEAKEKIKTFQREMTTFLQRKGKRDSVYQLSVSFFPLTKTNNKPRRTK